MEGWAKAMNIQGSLLKFYGDTSGALTRALGLELNDPGVVKKLGGNRCKRHAIIVEDLVIKHIFVASFDNDPAGDSKPDITLAEHVLRHL
mmetsp:Transcript_25923/g.59906  ORF Transcript_25923/g.59906 Transcript_25923/m.59906 type:complete len:90 (+) Transcript_25923:316-585(+)